MKIIVNTDSNSTNTSIVQLPILTAGDVIHIELDFVNAVGAKVSFVSPIVQFILYKGLVAPKKIVASITDWTATNTGFAGYLSLKTEALLSEVTNGAVALTLGVRVTSGLEARTYVTAPVTVRPPVEDINGYDPLESPEWATVERVTSIVQAAIPTITYTVAQNLGNLITTLARQSDMDAVIETIATLARQTELNDTNETLAACVEAVDIATTDIDTMAGIVDDIGIDVANALNSKAESSELGLLAQQLAGKIDTETAINFILALS